MEQLTTYRAQGKEIGLVFLFKYDLNGNLKLFEICEGVLNKEQRHWLLTGYLPEGVKFENAKQLLAQLEPRFPDEEKIMTNIWMKDEKYTKVFLVTVSPADLSFDALWNLYDYKVSRQDAEKQFKKLKPAEIIKCFTEVPFYLDHLKKNPGIGKLHLATYINKKRYEDERPQIAMKVGKVFNPMLKDLASKKTSK